jgi:hypothetical protein
VIIVIRVSVSLRERKDLHEFLAIMGVNLAMNLIGKLFRPKVPAYNPTYFSSMSKSLAQNSAQMQKLWEMPKESQRFAFDFEVPDPPGNAGKKFAELVEGNENERTAYLNKFQQKKNEVKEEFFSKNHYKTEADDQGKHRVALRDGKPTVEQGKEMPEQRSARTNYELTTKAEMFTKHANEKQTLVQEQKQHLMTFLDSNKFQLANPGVQGELSKLVVDSQKKALKMQEDHEEEFYKIDLPVKEMQAMVDENMLEYRQMKQKHEEIENNSNEAKQLANYQQDLVAFLDAKRAEVREQQKADMFLMDPRKFMKGETKTPDLASVLPMNLTVALDAFDIHSLPA